MAEIVFHPEALKEYQAAIAWYQFRSLSAARRLMNDVEHVMEIVATHPDRYGWFEEPFREAGLRRYPYSIIYRVNPQGDVLVLAFAHARREPGYWRGRSASEDPSDASPGS